MALVQHDAAIKARPSHPVNDLLQPAALPLGTTANQGGVGPLHSTGRRGQWSGEGQEVGVSARVSIGPPHMHT